MFGNLVKKLAKRQSYTRAQRVHGDGGDPTEAPLTTAVLEYVREHEPVTTIRVTRAFKPYYSSKVIIECLELLAKYKLIQSRRGSGAAGRVWSL